LRNLKPWGQHYSVQIYGAQSAMRVCLDFGLALGTATPTLFSLSPRVVRENKLQGSLEFGCCSISTADGDPQGDEEERGKKNNHSTVKFIIFRLVCVNKRKKEAVNNEKHF
jgi:hypothetical protein